ncbi:uncharacterized protein ATC70_007668 [Mucor velutinosus]|uniref:F-box domain-containing protein n=1 Tax=Mucor velutinosus TaxID=708070 RepID=A0AAN7HW34_9FUNG|nr:hypothetical protein ATC70_007668 [Mucor velutinosus]
MWSRLPQELLIKVFGYIDLKSQLAECRLVCKCWYSQADATLLGQHIVLENDGDVLQLCKFLNGDPARGGLFKHLMLLGAHFHVYLMSQLVHLVFTSTLEKFEGRLEGCGSHVLLEINSNAFSDTSGFDRLTILPTPQEFTLMYFITLLKFKRSLQSMALYLTDLNHRLEQQYIMKHLPDFKALVVLDLKIKINNLEIELDTECAFIMSEKRLLEWTTSSIVVAESLNILEVRGCSFGDVFEYLCYKYPNVHTIKLDISEYTTPSLLFPAYNMTEEQITIQSTRISKQLINKFSRAGIHLALPLPETDSMKLERLALVLYHIDGTQQLKYDAKQKLIICVGLAEESA